MAHFRINFQSPWYLLLLIPAIAFTLIPYFRSPKKYRRNRNRITSIVLHAIVMVLGIAVLAGTTFEYELPKKENALILLVDKSHSGESAASDKDSFVYEVLKSANSKVKVGVVTFGYDQVLASPFDTNTDKVYTNYLSAMDPDTSATNFADALMYASTLFEDPEAGRIVVLSDGVQTDGDAAFAVKTVAAMGIKVDTVLFPNEQKNEVQIVSVKLPDETIRHGEKFTLTLDLQSSYQGEALLTMYDDATMMGEALTVNLEGGTQTVELETVLAVPGLHKLTFEISAPGDTQPQNNSYNTYVNIHIFDKILILESQAGESTTLKNMITDDKNVTVIGVGDTEKMPKTVEDLRNYDEIIMVNVANSDMPDGFDDVLYEYVTKVGGGLFTICGNKEDGNPNDEHFEANAFTRDDMYGSTYQKLLPVEVINYTPPLGVIIVIDCSGSMYNGSEVFEDSKLARAMEGAKAALDALTERDWVGVMTFEENYSETLKMTPRTDRNKILAAIDDIPKEGGATNFTPALERAGSALLALKEVEKRHIILVTDGYPTDTEAQYGAIMKRNADAGITLSIVGIEADATATRLMTTALTTYAGVSEEHFYDVDDPNMVGTVLRQDLQLPEIKDVNYGEFTPTVETLNGIVSGVDLETIPSLDGFYGSKAKEGAEVVLAGEFVPIYAQWQVGKGRVGSFMCDLNGTWSGDFTSSETGKTLVNNMITSLFPSENIQVSSIQVTLKEQNYGNQMNIFTQSDPEDTVEIRITPKFGQSAAQQITGSVVDGFGRFAFELRDPDVYEIVVVRRNAAGEVIANTETTLHKAFSYSQEYNPFYDAEDAAVFMESLAQSGKGVVIEDSSEVLSNVLKYLKIVVNPRIAFIIIALIAFLADIAVRKFKFKWPHEIIKAYREKKKAS